VLSFSFAHFPIILLVVPVAVHFLGLVTSPEETHAAWYGMLNMLFAFLIFLALNVVEKENYAAKKHYFWSGEVGMATILAGMFAVPDSDGSYTPAEGIDQGSGKSVPVMRVYQREKKNGSNVWGEDD
jgi:hypothetical protein